MVNSAVDSRPSERRLFNNSRYILLACAIATIGIFIFPFGRIIGLPLIILSTLFHEIGHGLAAVSAGHEFHQLSLWADGSGLASITGASGFGMAIVAAGGLFGPPVAAALSFLAAKRTWSARIWLTCLGIGLAVLGILYVRNLFGFGFVGLLSTFFIWLAIQNHPWHMQATLAFMAVQLSLSVFSRIDYLFTKTAITANGFVPSDVAAIAEVLFLPYWFWGIVCTFISIVVLTLGLWSYVKK